MYTHCKFVPFCHFFSDTIPYENLPPQAVGSEELAAAFGYQNEAVSAVELSGTGAVVCGSPGEVANNPFLDGIFDSFTRFSRTTKIVNFGQQKKNIWLMSALGMHGLGQDQLRQKMAWALSQILVVSSDAIDLGNTRTEFFMAYYDIFVSHALLCPWEYRSECHVL